MGLKDRGYVLRLERCAQKLSRFNVAINQTSLVGTVPYNTKSTNAVTVIQNIIFSLCSAGVV